MTPRDCPKDPPPARLSPYVAVILVTALPVIAFRCDVLLGTREAAVAADVVQILCVVALVVLLLLYATTIFSSPLFSIILACLGWQCLAMLDSLYDLFQSDPAALLRFPPDAVFLKTMLGLNALAVIPALIVTCRRLTWANTVAALIVHALALVACATWLLSQMGL